MNREEFFRYLTYLIIAGILLLFIIGWSIYIIHRINQKYSDKLEFDHFFVSSKRIILEVDQEYKISAFAANIFSKPIGGYSVGWSIIDNTIADCSENGLVKAKKTGVTEVWAFLVQQNMSDKKYSRLPHHSRGVEQWIIDQNREFETRFQNTDYVEIIEVVVVPDNMVMVPRGEFILGGGEFNALPVKRIYLDDYYIDKHEVTNEEFTVFLNDGHGQYWDYQMDIRKRDGEYTTKEGRELFPVTYVSWTAATAYAHYMGKRLPTECEWEKAARGNKDQRIYFDGDSISKYEANFRNSGDPYEMGTTPVGFYNGINLLANGEKTRNSLSMYGVYDLAGNVHEWVNDWYDKDYYKIIPKINPMGPDTTVERSIRGGGWFDTPARLGVSYRTSGRPDLRNEFVGFRCAKSYE